MVAAFGDNLSDTARAAAKPLGLAESSLSELQALGECLNYNGYRETVEDLFFHPAELYGLIHAHADPFTFICEDRTFQILKSGYDQDMAQAQAIQPMHESAAGSIYLLPDAAWSRRVSWLICWPTPSVRQPRFKLPGVPAYVVQRGNNRQAVFYEAQDYAAYLNWLRRGATRYGCAIPAYALMT